MNPIYNLADADQNNFDIVDTDRYDLVIEKAEVAKTKKGDDMLKVTFVILGPKFKKRKLWSQFTLTQKALPFLAKFIKVVDPSLLKNGIDMGTICKGIINKTVSAYVDVDTTRVEKPGNKLSDWAVSNATYTPEATSSYAAPSPSAGNDLLF